MFETRSDVICCSSGCRGGKAWHGGGAAGSQAISTFPRHRSHQAAAVRSGAKSRTVSRVRPVRDRTRVAHAARCKRGHRCQAGSMALRRCRRRPLFLLVDGLRRSCRRCIRRGLDVDALSRSGRDCSPDAVEVVGVSAVRTHAFSKAGSRRKGIPGRSKTRREQ